jgi:hypothetical protein
MGRKIEETMLHVIAAQAKDAGAVSMSAEYLATPRNQPSLRFLQASGMTRNAERQPERAAFRWDLNKEYPLPGFVTLSWVHGTDAACLSLSLEHAAN